jgi:hypothetical protein
MKGADKLNICFWPLADILTALPNVRFRGGKAEWRLHREMSAYDPKRTLCGAEQSELAIITSTLLGCWFRAVKMYCLATRGRARDGHRPMGRKLGDFHETARPGT